MMRRLAACLACVALAACKGSFSGRKSQRVYLRAPPTSPEWLSTATGLGASTYYVGTGVHTVHTRYPHYSYDEYYKRQAQDPAWRSRHPRRAGTAGCTPPGGVHIAATQVWLVAQIVTTPNATMQDGLPLELEVDLFHELLFRAPCTPPTQVVTMTVCKFDTNRFITSHDRTTPALCYLTGTVESISSNPLEHQQHRRKLLSTGDDGYTVVEISVGAATLNDVLALRLALHEALRDQQGLFQQHYQTEEDVLYDEPMPPTCRAYSCDEGCADLPGKDTIKCNGEWCTEAECCAPLCSSFVCSSFIGSGPDSSVPAARLNWLCNGVCTDALCCVSCADLGATAAGPWHDGDGFTCDWYESIEDHCQLYGSSSRNLLVANEACCTCGGGRTGRFCSSHACTSGVTKPTYQQIKCENDSCSDEQCCQAECLDLSFPDGRVWSDKDGTTYTCEWYASESRCANHGALHRNILVADEACCACGGGVKAYNI